MSKITPMSTSVDLLKAIRRLSSSSFFSSRIKGSQDSQTTSFSEMAKAIQESLKTPQCVAIFIRDNESPPKRLILKGNAGYRDNIGEVIYDLNASSVTKSVFEGLVVENRSSLRLTPQSMLRCASCMPKGRFINSLIIPICTSSKVGEAECFGVLKIENDGDDPAQPVSEPVEAAGVVLAHLLALQCERHWYGDLWDDVERKKGEDGSAHLSRLEGTLCRMLRADAAFLYSLSKEGDWLYFQGGTFPMKDHEAKGDSLLSSTVGFTRRCLPFGSQAIESRGLDSFLNELQSPSRAKVTDLLVANAVDEKGHCSGVLVVTRNEIKESKESKESEEGAKEKKQDRSFTTEDEQTALELGKRIGPYLMNAKHHGDAWVNGFEELQKVCGPPPDRLKGIKLSQKAREVQRARARSQGRITGADCARYLKIKRTYFLKLVKPSENPSP